MKRVIGFALLCAAFGMLVLLMIPAVSFWRFVLLVACMAGGYILFCK